MAPKTILSVTVQRFMAYAVARFRHPRYLTARAVNVMNAAGKGRGPRRTSHSPTLTRHRAGTVCPRDCAVCDKQLRDRKQEQFTALIHLKIDLLRDSFYVLKRQAAPGV